MAPEHRGSWWENRRGTRVHPSDIVFLSLDSKLSGPPPMPPFMVLPNHFAVKHAMQQDIEAPSQNFESVMLSPNLMNRLPTELLVRILEPLLPRDRKFHFTPLEKPRVSVHQICETDESPNFRISPLALVCKRFKDVVYSTFYGGNRFILEVSPTGEPLTSYLSSWVKQPQVDFNRKSWCKVHLHRQCEEQADPLLPLTPRTLRFISDLTVCISLISLPVREEDSKASKAKAVLAKLCTSLARAENRFKRLVIRLDTAEEFSEWHVTRQLRITKHCEIYTSESTNAPIELGDGEKEGLRKMCSSLLELGGIDNARLEGLLVREDVWTVPQDPTPSDR